jgi:tRNA(Ile)-lysidine synthase
MAQKSSLYALELKSYCEDKNISFSFDQANKENISSEEKAREWRYQKLCEIAKTTLKEKQQNKNIYLLTGHTSTDNAETFILNLSRGSNLAGLSNIESKRLLENQIFLIRPILIFSREDTKQFCDVMNIPVWEDPTNSDIKLKRNLVRKKIIPTLEVIYPGCSERINNFSQKMSNYNNERNDLSELAYLYCKDVNGIKRNLLNSMCIEARCTILNRFLKEISKKQYSSKNLVKIAN